MIRRVACLTIALLGLGTSPVGDLRAAAAPARSVEAFEQQLERLRASSHIAGVSAVIASGQQVVWARGFGQADVTSGRAATTETIYHLASLTKPWAAVVLLQLVQEGKLSLDDPVSKYGIDIIDNKGPGVVRVRHLLSHTSEGVPGERYNYNGDRYGLLDAVIAQAGGKRLGPALEERIIGPLGLRRTAPNPKSPGFVVSGQDRSAYEAQMAVGYTWRAGAYVRTEYPDYFGSAAGLTASALDVAAFSMAMDRDALLRPETKALAYTPAIGAAGRTLPYGLGWFSTTYRGTRVIWHYGLWVGNSSLIIKVPDRGVTFVALANTDGLSASYQLGSGKLESSPWARAFLDSFVIGPAPLSSALLQDNAKH
jgi:CubicO group peptidase (beta-lactamase class C family)